MRRCDERLLSIKVPDIISRVPRTLEDVKHWKGKLIENNIICLISGALTLCLIGSELRNWVLYFSLPVLNEILPDPYYTHFAHFVGAIHLLSASKVLRDDLETAEALLSTFYAQFSELYGK